MDRMTFSRRRFLALSASLALPGCVAPKRLTLVAPDAKVAGTQTLLVATARAAHGAPIAFGPERAEGLGFARLTISIPPHHKTGRFEWPRWGAPNPARHFALIGAEKMPNAAALVRAARSPDYGAPDETVVFVHGFNTNFAKGVFRHAQIAWDYELRGPQIHFAWPSSARPLGYLYDRDSALIARDALVDVLRHLHGEPRLRVSLIGHSMGGFLIMEALRQIALLDGHDMLDRLASVTLISPDIDIDLFRSQAETLGPLPQPFVIAVARNDRFLRISSRLSNGQERLGAIEDLAALQGLDVTVIDLTALGSGGSNHALPRTSKIAIEHMRAFEVDDLMDRQRITLRRDGASFGVPHPPPTPPHAPQDGAGS